MEQDISTGDWSNLWTGLLKPANLECWFDTCYNDYVINWDDGSRLSNDNGYILTIVLMMGDTCVVANTGPNIISGDCSALYKFMCEMPCI